MSISIDDKKLTFSLHSKNNSYIFGVNPDGYLVHHYWGRKIESFNVSGTFRNVHRAITAVNGEDFFSLETARLEAPSFGLGDARNPLVGLRFKDGSRTTDFRYKSHRLLGEKKNIQGLPQTYDEKGISTSLEIILEDVKGVEIVLNYTVFDPYDAIVRSVEVVNKSEDQVTVTELMSGSVDFNDQAFDVLHLPGTWAREREISKVKLERGRFEIDSRKGASSAQANPFLSLVRSQTDEFVGEVYAFNLVYSSNFKGSVEKDAYGMTRMNMGINPYDFSWTLNPGETLQSPEVVMVYSNQGLNKMSESFHGLYTNCLTRGKHRHALRPILVNNWEATYFDFDNEKIKSLIDDAKELGFELFVLDDGWFGKRDDDTTSLGDWFIDEAKLPSGLIELSDHAHSINMKFGLWFEPEMISKVSKLYESHPDWCIHVEGRERTESRQQLVLDMSREDVQDYLIEVISNILKENKIDYVKWDMNRNITEAGSALLKAENQSELYHRYILGLYRVLETLVTRHEDVLFESCASGGARFDPGMLYYMPQTWTSDNTDAISRLKIQYGTSLAYPQHCMGAHISAVPNHQVNRMTSIDLRGHVSMPFNFGYELDTTKLTEDERKKVKLQLEEYKTLRPLLQYGKFIRLASPFEGNLTAWMTVNDKCDEAVVFCYRVLKYPNPNPEYIKCAGLNPELMYQVNDEVYSGSQLMHFGLLLNEMEGDFESQVFKIKAINNFS